MTHDEFREAFDDQLRKVYSGVVMQIDDDPINAAADPPHLRTGINACMAQISGMVHLMIAKGICTEDEYFEYVLNAAAAEAKRYEAILSAHFGKPVKLG